VPVDFLFQGIEDACPRIRTDSRTGERHCVPEPTLTGISKTPE
jgi:hypothetical protein